MLPADSLVILSTASLTGLAMVAGSAVWGWQAWLKFRTREIDHGGRAQSLPAIGQRIDLADLKERIRKLEAIAAGVEM